MLQKIWAQETGWLYVAELLVNAGAPAPGPDVREWLRLWLPLVTRPLSHPGNHRYAWLMHRNKHASQ